MAQLIHALLAAAVHENKNLMQEVLYAIDTLAGNPATHAASGEIQALRRLSKRMVDGSMQVLAIYHAGLDADDFNVNYNMVPLEVFLLELAAEARDIVLGKAILIDVLFDDALPEFWIFDSDLIRIAVRNGLYNAAEFTQNQITLSLTYQDDMLCIRVEDNGQPKEIDAPRPTASGFGILIADTLARAHHDKLSQRNGHVRLTPPTTERGAIFELYLP